VYNQLVKYTFAVKKKSQQLRKTGYSHAQIAEKLSVPRGTVVSWNRNIQMAPSAVARLERRMEETRNRGRRSAMEAHQQRKLVRKQNAKEKASGLAPVLNDSAVKELVLAALYLGEGSKGDRSALTFGNSDPEIITLFLRLLRSTKSIDESRFRCTVQVRAGQDVKRLECFWSQITEIPLTQFYTARVDIRGGGKVMRKPEYKGVCRLDYLSTVLLYEVLAVGTMLTQGGP
jgi:hypothetical protein